MTVERARVIKAVSTGTASVAPPDGRSAHAPSHPQALARRVPREVVDAHAEAERIVSEAQAYATEMVAEATAKVAATVQDAAREAREREIARVAAEVLVARSTEERRAERELDHTVQVAVLLAERLVGEAIAVEPSRVAALAAGALKETRGARQVRVEASAEDVPVLVDLLASLGEGVATVEPSHELARGSLVVHTELGRVDARLAPQLSRLAEALREVLKSDGIEGGRGSARE